MSKQPFKMFDKIIFFVTGDEYFEETASKIRGGGSVCGFSQFTLERKFHYLDQPEKGGFVS